MEHWNDYHTRTFMSTHSISNHTCSLSILLYTSRAVLFTGALLFIVLHLGLAGQVEQHVLRAQTQSTDTAVMSTWSLKDVSCLCCLRGHFAMKPFGI